MTLVEEHWLVRPPFSQFGKGDLVFKTDIENGSHLVVECKCLSPLPGATARTRRRKKRRDVYEQAIAYARAYAQTRDHSGAQVIPITFTNERIESMPAIDTVKPA